MPIPETQFEVLLMVAISAAIGALIYDAYWTRKPNTASTTHFNRSNAQVAALKAVIAVLAVAAIVGFFVY